MNHRTGRKRVRELGLSIGRYPTGPYNAITDVSGVRVGHTTLRRDAPAVIRTGVTVILPRDGRVHEDYPAAGFFSFNGIGEMTGLPLIAEWGLLTSPIVLTSTHQVGMAWDALTQYGSRSYGGFAYKLPVVAETYDGVLSDANTFPLTAQDVIAALETAQSGPVEEGGVGGGTGMICYEFKGGIGTSSRLVEVGGAVYTVAALVQANHGTRPQLRMNGIHVGEILSTQVVPSPFQDDAETAPMEQALSSIIGIIATDAPLTSLQCQRLARRGTVGLARTGGVGFNSSGDLFLAFATGNHYPPSGGLHQQVVLPHHWMDPMIEAAADVVEESILNALTCAETVTGYQNHTAHAIPLDRLEEIVRR